VGVLDAEVVAAGKSQVRSQNGEVRCRQGWKVVLVLAAAGALLASCRKWDNPLDPIGNRPPEVPSHPSPTDSGIGKDVGLVLSWRSVDPDIGDTAYFDVFLGTDTNPSLVRDRLTKTNFQPTNVACSTQYYWRIVAYDNHDDSAVGPLWRFQTVPALAVTAPDTGDRLEVYSTDTIAWTGGPTTASRTTGRTSGAIQTSGRSLAPERLARLDSTIVFRSTDDGVSWTRLDRATAAGLLVWQVAGPATESARVRVVVYASGDTVSGISGRFEIYDTMPPATTQTASQDDASVWVIGSMPDAARFGGTRRVYPPVVCFSSANSISRARQYRAVMQRLFFRRARLTCPRPAV
jgi:hypothetical protein